MKESKYLFTAAPKAPSDIIKSICEMKKNLFAHIVYTVGGGWEELK